ncbi:hypothetical protein [Novosphingobium sp.]|uniref:calcium-binding protein n=1 Tax=Novosphingobium sp. TaxID=1874826 RepID=UPI002612C278|nr:hypothetical protein [Novosphingobium sp.]
MATATIKGLAGTSASNFFTDSTLQILLYDQSSNPTFSPDNLSVTYTLNSDYLTFKSLDGLNLFTLTGTVIGVSNPFYTVEGLNIAFRDLGIAAGNGDVGALNDLIWAGNDKITGGASNDELRGFAGNDYIFGGAGNDKIYGDDGADRLFGSFGDDRLYGGAGNDSLDGGGGNDRILGGAGDDRIIGSKGLDNVYGGQGADTFVFNSLADFAPYNPKAAISFDIIRDFNHAQGDLIDLQRIDADATRDGNQAFQLIDGTAFTENAPGTVLVETFASNIFVVRLNTDNDASAEVVLIVVTPSTLANPTGLAPTAADFIL